MRNAEPFMLSAGTRGIFEELPRRLYGARYGAENAPDGLPFFVVRDNSGNVLARAAVWENPDIAYLGETPGLIGSFECVDDVECAAAVLGAAEARLRMEGRRRVVGPMNGSTWAPYRLALPEGAPCLFPLEPRNPAYYCAYWESLGYHAIANYTSSSFPLRPDSFPRLELASAVLPAHGVTVSDFRPDKSDDELNAIYEVSVASFRSNFLYTPLSRAGFLAKYRPIASRLRPQDVVIARNADGKPVGFAFGFPNAYAPIGTEYVIKTAAVLPEHAGRGLGGLLVDRLARMAYDDGFESAYHALMHESNISCNLGRHAHAKVCRRYSLYAKDL